MRCGKNTGQTKRRGRERRGGEDGSTMYDNLIPGMTL
jgi:hypothetical protein